MNAPRMRSRTSPRAWLGVLCVALCVVFKSAHGVANIELFEPPLPFPVETHPLELSAAMFASDLPLANATVKFRPTDDAQTTLGDIPFPTGAWWTNLVLEQGDNFVSTMPYMLRVLQGKLQVAYPFRVVLPGIIQNGFISELVLTGGSKAKWQQQVVGFDSLGVAVRFTAPQDADAGAFTAHLVRGSPYLTVDYDGTVPVIESADGIKLQKLKRLDTIMTDMEGKPLTFPVFAVQNSGGHTWYIFGSDESLDLSLRKGKITGNAKYTGVLRFALALTGDALPLLVESAPVYPVGGEVKYEVDPKTDSAVVEFAWKTHTFPGFSDASKLLMLALPHHNDTLTETSVTRIDDLRYTAIRGIMVGVLGDTWQMQEELPPIEWNYAKDQGLFNPTASSGPEEDAKRAKMVQDVTELLVENLKKDIQTFPHFAVDSYGFGKQLGREVRLLLIADSLGQKEEFNHQLEKIKRELEPWLAATNGDTLVYDERFGGLVTRNGLHDSNADFGNGYYNDHHFHYGYYMHGLAALRKFDPEFISKYASAAAMLIADIGTPLDSTKTKFFSDFPARHYFPTARHKDWFVGHSYASGLFQMEVGKSQESSSECINAYYGMALFGSLDDNAAQDPLSYYNYARMMLALELRSTKKYWHMRENSKVYEPLFAKNAMVGVLGEMSVVYSTWFGDRPEYVHGINMIPFTPITAELFNEGYVVREYGQLRPRFEALGPEDIWKSIIVMNHAILDGQTAWNDLLKTVTAFDDSWNSKTNALFWIATRPSWFDQRDRAKLNEVNLHDEEKCFGFPACAIAGANGTSLACCDTMPGCCPSSLGCCPQKDLSKLPINSCFGEQKCAALGLGCCASIDGCCEPNPFTGEVLGCCKDPTPRSVTPAPSMESDDDSSSSGFCTSQPKCDAAGLLCCESEEGCCKPDPVTGGKLDCCVAEPTSLKTCHSQPQCLAAGLLCCGTADGCCKPDPITGGKLDCCIDTHGAELNETTPIPVSAADTATCHNEPKCGEAGLDCCGTTDGCCQPDPVTGGKLLCCEGSAPTPIPQELVDPFGTCHGDIACLTAGDNGTALGCCGSREGCCPGLLCCAHHEDADGEETTTTTGGDDKEPSKAGSHALLITVGIVLLMVLAYGITTCYRRRQYAPIEQDMRAWWCGALGLFVFVFFVYLVAMA